MANRPEDLIDKTKYVEIPRHWLYKVKYLGSVVILFIFYNFFLVLFQKSLDKNFPLFMALGYIMFLMVFLLTFERMRSERYFARKRELVILTRRSRTGIQVNEAYVKIRQGFIGKIFGYGSISASNPDSGGGIRIDYVKDPYNVAQQISEKSEIGEAVAQAQQTPVPVQPAVQGQTQVPVQPMVPASQTQAYAQPGVQTQPVVPAQPTQTYAQPTPVVEPTPTQSEQNPQTPNQAPTNNVINVQ